jgi:hypothetical protein
MEERLRQESEGKKREGAGENAPSGGPGEKEGNPQTRGNLVCGDFSPEMALARIDYFHNIIALFGKIRVAYGITLRKTSLLPTHAA